MIFLIFSGLLLLKGRTVVPLNAKVLISFRLFMSIYLIFAAEIK